MSNNPLFPPESDVIVPAALLNNMAHIINQQTAITSDQHRDLENLLALVRERSTIFYD